MTRGGVRPAEGFAFEATSTLKCWIFQLTTFATFMAGIPSNAGSGGDADTNASCYVSSVMTHLLKICHAPVTSHFTLEKQGRTKKNGCILSSCVVEIWILDFRNKDGSICLTVLFCFVTYFNDIYRVFLQLWQVESLSLWSNVLHRVLFITAF